MGSQGRFIKPAHAPMGFLARVRWAKLVPCADGWQHRSPIGRKGRVRRGDSMQRALLLAIAIALFCSSAPAQAAVTQDQCRQIANGLSKMAVALDDGASRSTSSGIR